MRCLADFSAEWDKYSTHVDKLGKHLGTVQNTFDQLAGARTNQLQRKLNRIDDLQTGGPEVLAVEASEWPRLRPVATA